MTTRAVVVGCGHYLPKRVVENAEFEKTLDTNDEWIRSRSGIERRHFAGEDETTSSMATAAAQAALDQAGLTADDVDAIVLATSTADLTFPSAATMVQAQLGMKGGFAFDVQAVCAGFVFALSNANALIASGQAKRVLVIGSDDVLPSQPYWKSFEAELTKLEPASKATYYNLTVPEWATKLQTTTQSALLQDPSINYIVPLYDSMSQFILPALAITGKRGQVPIASFNGTPFVIDLVQNGDVAMDLGESLGWIARSTLDAYMRDLCGVDDVPSELYVPFLIFDETNAETAGKPAGFDTGYGDAHVGGYRALWGLE